VNRPLSNAPTTFMPELHPQTVPLHIARYCGWCGIPLAAIPDEPVEHRGRRYHNERCLTAHLLSGPSRVSLEHRGTSDPR
jgi:hypothetical protein